MTESTRSYGLMIHLFINALAASAGGGLTYMRNVLPRLAIRDDVHATVLLGAKLAAEVQPSPRVTFLLANDVTNSVRRLWYEQCVLPGTVRRSGAEVLLCTGNFALYRSPIPQILLSRNALYLSRDFQRDLRNRGEYSLWLGTEVKAILARWSIRAAELTVAPSLAFAADLKQWAGKDVVCIHHGFNPEVFFRDQSPLPPIVKRKLAATPGSLRLLFVSHYNYYRNFETLIRAIAILKKKLHPRPVRLFLTCSLSSKRKHGGYNSDSAAALVESLHLSSEIVELGQVPYSLLHKLYRACDLYVTPAYAETFAHPLVEAMASGVPVLASDLAVHREICGAAARYFPRFSPEILADRVVQILESPEMLDEMRNGGISRSHEFRWDEHVKQLLEVAERLRRESMGLHKG